MSRYQYVWRLKVVYPEGSHEKGWRPAIWGDPEFLKKLPRDERRALRHREFRWPRERMFLSSSGAWGRAVMLLSYGAQVDVQRSERIRWPEEPPTEPASPVTLMVDGAPEVLRLFWEEPHVTWPHVTWPHQGWREEPGIPRFGADEVDLCGYRRAVTGAGRRISACGSGVGVSSVRLDSGRPLKPPGCVLSSPRVCLSQW